MLICEETEAYKRGWVTCSILEKWTSWDEEPVFLPSDPCSSSPSGDHILIVTENKCWLKHVWTRPACAFGPVFLLCLSFWARTVPLAKGHITAGGAEMKYRCAGGVFPACTWNHSQCRMELELGKQEGPEACSLHAASFQWDSNSLSWGGKNSLAAATQGLTCLKELGYGVLLNIISHNIKIRQHH